MREVRLKYSAATILNSSLKELFEVASRVVLRATLYHDWDQEWIRQIYEVVLQDGKEVDDLDNVSFINLENTIHQRRENGRMVHTVMSQNSHPLSFVGKSISDAAIIPGSEISMQGATLLIRGAPSGVKKMVDGFRSWRNPSSISVVDVDLEESENGQRNLSEHQASVFIAAHSNGYYDTPRGISLVDLSRNLNLSRSTVAGHLRSVEKMMADRLARELDDA